MVKIVIINGSKKFDGISSGIYSYREALNRLGCETRWIQCVGGTHVNDYDLSQESVYGINLFNSSISEGFNRLITFPFKLKKVGADFILLSDPTLLRVAVHHDNVLLKVHDLRPLTKFRDNLVLPLLYKLLLPLLERVKGIIVTTEFMKEEIGNLGVQKSKVFIVPDSIHLN